MGLGLRWEEAGNNFFITSYLSYLIGYYFVMLTVTKDCSSFYEVFSVLFF